MSEDRITPVGPPPSSEPHVTAVGASVLDKALRETGTHREQVTLNAATRSDIAELTSAIRFYAKTQLVGFLMLSLVVGAMAWRAWVYSDQMMARFRVSDERWQRLDERLQRIEAKP